MQLRKQAIRKMPTFHPITAPQGVHRDEADYNQVNNTQQRNRNAKGDSFRK